MTSEQTLQEAVRLHLAGEVAAAARLYRRVLAAHPKHADALHLLGLAHMQTGRPGAALPLLEKAIAQRGDVAAFHGNLGTVLLALGREREARAAYERSVAVDAAYADGWRNLGSLCSRMSDQASAARAYGEAARLGGGRDGEALGYLGLSLASICDWDRLDAVRAQILAAAAGGEEVALPVPPFSMLIHEVGPDLLRRAADRAAAFVRRRARGDRPPPFAHAARPRRARLRVAYLGDDFRDHAIGYLIAETLERHDRDRFEIFAYSYWPADAGAQAKRLRAGVDRFVEIATLAPAAAAQRIFADGIDILVDLKGHTGTARGDIVALRPAPITVNYLGYPGTWGGDCVDYILADRSLIPAEAEPHYAERVVCLPLCYQANDGRRPRPAAPPRKQDFGFDPDSILLCAFHNSFKISREMFGCWLGLLAAHPRAKLWLLEFDSTGSANLRRAAEAAGIAPGRLVFAPRLGQAEHLARIGAADLFLDAYPYGGHTSASDALWAGVPVVTRSGPCFQSRVGASLLGALGLDELIAPDLDSYRALADRLLADTEALARLRKRVTDAAAASPLFSGSRAARDLERAYDAMWERFASGQRPQGFVLPAA